MIILIRNGIFSTFLTASRKADLWAKASRVLKERGIAVPKA